MRWQEIAGGLQVALTNEEHDLYERICKHESVTADSLNERDREVSNKLVQKDILKRYRDDNQLKLRPNQIQQNWRF